MLLADSSFNSSLPVCVRARPCVRFPTCLAPADAPGFPLAGCVSRLANLPRERAWPGSRACSAAKVRREGLRGAGASGLEREGRQRRRGGAEPGEERPCGGFAASPAPRR